MHSGLHSGLSPWLDLTCSRAQRAGCYTTRPPCRGLDQRDTRETLLASELHIRLHTYGCTKLRLRTPYVLVQGTCPNRRSCRGDLSRLLVQIVEVDRRGALSRLLVEATWRGYLARLLGEATWRGYLSRLLVEATWRGYLARLLGECGGFLGSRLLGHLDPVARGGLPLLLSLGGGLELFARRLEGCLLGARDVEVVDL